MSDDGDAPENRADRPRGPWSDKGYNMLAISIAVGVALGAGIGTSLDNAAMGIAIGTAVGVAFSTVFGFGAGKDDEDESEG